MKQNCWQVKGCGRNPGGTKVEELGVCPASTKSEVHGINSGQNGGRSCWVIAGTLCGGKIQGTAAMKIVNCMNCDFFKSVWHEEKAANTYTVPAEIIRMLHATKRNMNQL